MTEKTMSERVVAFIGSLSPLYDMDYAEKPICARHLSTGARITPIDESIEGDECGLVALCYPGQTAPWVVESRFVATEALVRYVDVHHFGRPEKERRGELIRIADHFAFKTGASVYLQVDDDPRSEVFALSGKLLRELGTDVAVDVLKGLLHLP